MTDMIDGSVLMGIAALITSVVSVIGMVRTRPGAEDARPRRRPARRRKAEKPAG